jgi:hypothetical protein
MSSHRLIIAQGAREGSTAHEVRDGLRNIPHTSSYPIDQSNPKRHDCLTSQDQIN